MELGVNFVDTADVYAGGKTEEIVGKALGGPGVRDGVVLASKAGMNVGPGVNDEGISRFILYAPWRRACDGSRRIASTSSTFTGRCRP